MHDRIKELAEQANGPNPFYDTLKGQMTLLGDDAVAKFAELIVRECARVNYNSPFKDGEFHAREVLEHFGVE